MSFKCEVHTVYHGEDDWASNSLRFATYDEADYYGHELLSRWYVPDKYRVVETDEPVNYRYDYGQYKAVPIDR